MPDVAVEGIIAFPRGVPWAAVRLAETAKVSAGLDRLAEAGGLPRVDPEA